MMSERWIRRIGYAALAGSLALIVYATLSPDPTAPNTPGWVAHTLLFTALGGSAALAFANRRHPVVGLAAALLVSLAFATFTEVAQGPLPTRSPSLDDWMADAVGAIVGATAGTLLVRLLAGDD